MVKSTNILEFISILQFSQMHLIFKTNVSKEIKKMIAKNCKKFHVLQFSAFLGVHKGFFDHNHVVCVHLRSCAHPQLSVFHLAPDPWLSRSAKNYFWLSHDFY